MPCHRTTYRLQQASRYHAHKMQNIEYAAGAAMTPVELDLSDEELTFLITKACRENFLSATFGAGRTRLEPTCKWAIAELAKFRASQEAM